MQYRQKLTTGLPVNTLVATIGKATTSSSIGGSLVVTGKTVAVGQTAYAVSMTSPTLRETTSVVWTQALTKVGPDILNDGQQPLKEMPNVGKVSGAAKKHTDAIVTAKVA